LSFTYNATSSDFTTLNYIRREIGDVLSTDPLLTDEEINATSALEGSVLGQAARCCEWIATSLGRKADLTAGQLSIRYSQRAAAFTAMAQRLRSLDAITAVPYAGAVSIADKQATNDDEDQVQPSFWKGMSDNPNELPFGPNTAVDDTSTEVDD